jgi:hypothetical protein
MNYDRQLCRVFAAASKRDLRIMYPLWFRMRRVEDP